MKRVAILGASGFVGSTLVERLLEQRKAEIVPFIHNSGNAMRLARLGIDLPAVDLLDQKQLEMALRGCTHVVNCALGNAHAATRGLRNLLAASRKNKVQRFIHLSSVLVYGDPPPPDSVHESAQTHPTGTYGRVKLQQDRMVQQACRAGLPSIILCPPNISGPYSAFLIKLVDALRARVLALVDDGNTPCNLVDVSNLAYAIEIALDNGTADGKRMFITDDQKITWHDVIKSLIPIAECIEPVGVTREELRCLHGTNGKSSFSVMRSLKHVVSREVRAALRKDPFWAKLEEGLSQGVTRLGKVVEERLRLSIAGPPAITKPNGIQPYNMHLTAQQLRGVRHECDLAKQELGYKPVYTFAASMTAFSAWYHSQHGMDTGCWDLLKLLY